MSPSGFPSRPQALAAYSLSAAGTLLWVACALPSGPLDGVGSDPDAATPFHRATALLVPALLLLIVIPVGGALSRRERGLRAVLAGTDAFISGYALLALLALPVQRDSAQGIGLLLLAVLTVFSLLETWRCVTPRERPAPPRVLRGLRLALCLLALMTPAQLLLPEDRDSHTTLARTLLLAPFLLVALSAAGARLASGVEGLRRACAALQLALALLFFFALRFTIRDMPPELARVGPAGLVALGLGLLVLALALIHLLLLCGRPARNGEAGTPLRTQSPAG